MEKITIDAAGKKIGRVASDVAYTLMGKRSPTYQRHIKPEILVEVINASKLDVMQKKINSMTHQRYTGFHGGLKQPNLLAVIA